MVGIKARFQTVAVWLTMALSLCQGAYGDSRVEYVQDVKPILKSRCYACHGALKQEAGLRLDAGRFIRKGGDSGEVIVPGQPERSVLVGRVSAADLFERMPPEGDALSDAQIAVVKQWIADGAHSPADEQPEADPGSHWAFQPAVRPPVPTIGEVDLANPIDAFLQARLSQHDMPAIAKAGKHVVLRRVTLDLIGLPPTREELTAFLEDESPTAYESVVDRLLNDPRYGERWGRHWMDVWRYSDWYGRRHVPDVWNSASQIWRWRDWIVRSLNADHGYDRMVQEMLAADEIRPEDHEARVATGYLVRNWYALNPNDWMRNNVEHIGKAFLGLTFHCAHCHDHKYDPISQDDYFRMRAFFEPIYVRQDRVPGEADPGPFQDYEYSTLRKIQRLGAVSVFDKSPDAATWYYTGGDERNRVEERGSMAAGVPSFLAETLPEISPVTLPVEAWYPALRPDILQTMRGDAQVAVTAARQHFDEAKDSEAAPSQEALDRLAGSPTGATQAAARRAVRRATLPRLLAQASLSALRAEFDSLNARIRADEARIANPECDDVTALQQAASRREREAAVRRADADLLARELALATAEARPADESDRQKAIDNALKEFAAAKESVFKASAALDDQSLSDSYTPLGPEYPRTSTGRRAALARWITHRSHPLTARVAVNHIWMRHFHVPLVATVDNFGRSGAAPTHPELLDWLAVEFMESGWSMKHLHRLMVTSEAYQRRSGPADVSRAPLAADPDNSLLWRMNAGRMEAEVVRDSLLALGGLLEDTMGGQELENTDSLTNHRRSLYYATFPEQGGKSPLGELFDGPDALGCYRRTRSIVPQQALALTNSELVHDVSRRLAKRIRDEIVADSNGDQNSPHSFIHAAFEHVLTRPPTEEETRAGREYVGKPSPSGEGVAPDSAVWESLVRALLNHNDFVTIR